MLFGRCSNMYKQGKYIYDDRYSGTRTVFTMPRAITTAPMGSGIRPFITPAGATLKRAHIKVIDGKVVCDFY